ncbi:hypothetical protein COB57_05640 [Candidatus Peregrinibacteria bacterium]|nr:MAG: hypothetical protein COB57_05640 [Candidatus Peregrinibacteria bacterium]
MGLYLCILDKETEIDGIDVGSYQDYNDFIDTVVTFCENKEKGSVFPILTLHHDSDGTWTTAECIVLKEYFQAIKKQLKQENPIIYSNNWKENVLKESQIIPINLDESFFDVNGNNLIDRLIALCNLSIEKDLPIVFQ